MPDGQKQKIVILGGGMSSLTTAFELTNKPGWQDQYDITVYQVGWRLGGKGASGRGLHDRIEEHGLHIWIGFYENAFRLIRMSYKEMVERGLCPPNCPMSTFEEAFKKHELIMVEEQTKGGYKPWAFPCIQNDAVPGDPLPGDPNQGVNPEFPSPEEYYSMLIQLIHDLFRAAPQAMHRPGDGSLLDVLKKVGVGIEALGVEAAWQILELATNIAAKLSKTPGAHNAGEHAEMVAQFEKVIAWLRNLIEKDLEENEALRHLFVMIDLCVAAARGVIADGVISKGLSSIDDYDLREWLSKHGAAPESVDSAAVRFLYDLAFAYIDGDGNRPSLAAGTALRCIIRVFFTFKGAIFWKMQAGMGDTIFTPVYHCLSARGVKFKFFHRVREVVPNADGSSIECVRIGRQVDLENPAKEYYPVKTIGGINCWPSEPLFEQIKKSDVDALKVGNIDLESFWTPWQEKEEVVLEAGKDFDKVVLGISLAALKYICPKIMDQKSKWRDMYDNVKTTRTMGLQLWLKPDLEGLAWTHGSPVLDGYVNPLNTWADMSQLLVREDWSGAETPKSLAYFCGTVTGGIPPETEAGYPKEASDWAYNASQQWLAQNTRGLWSKAAAGENSPSLDWDLLVDDQNSQGPDRLKSQFWRVNIDPSERYVLSVAGSTKYRIKADESGYDNLILTGDWIDNGFNAGCIEAAVMSGMLASNAVAGYPGKDEIIGMGKP